MRLEVELIPMQLWGTSIANRYPRQWDKLRKECYQRAGYRCEICGGHGQSWPVEAHEVWEYDIDDSSKTASQRLVRLIALCPDCHRFKHFGRSRSVLPEARIQALIEHACRVNRCTPVELAESVRQAKSSWTLRNSYTWTQDLSPFLETDTIPC
jgi:hypothetical protein